MIFCIQSLSGTDITIILHLDKFMQVFCKFLLTCLTNLFYNRCMKTAISISLSNKTLKIIDDFSKENNLDFDASVSAIVQLYNQMVELPVPKNEDPPEVDKVSFIIDFFKLMYRKRYQLATDEKIHYAEVSKFFEKIIEGGTNEEVALEIFQKVIIWYIYFFNKTKSDGTHYSAELNSLISRGWIFKSCFEQSSEYGLELLLRAAKRGIDVTELKRFSRSGDSLLQNDNKISLQDVLLLSEEMVELIGEGVRKIPEILPLYQGHPDQEELKNAKKALENMKTNLNETR